MKNYINPMVEITLISAEDVLTLSLISEGHAMPTKSERVGNEAFWG